ncbi:MAG TPA: glucuronate isomerase [Trueperaceae bacterium]|nr:glucuronate isomerase [Trueperaceae bacterium]
MEKDPRQIWRTFCAHFHLFDGTPTGLWLKSELIELFGLDVRPSPETADATYDHLAASLAGDTFRPRALFERFGIEVLATTDAATDDLAPHAAAQRDGLPVVPTFRPDALLATADEAWPDRLRLLEERAGMAVEDLGSFLEAVRRRRQHFRQLGATASDHGVADTFVRSLERSEAEVLFDKALKRTIDQDEATRLASHLLFEMAGMAAEDGLVMQLHVGSFRNHNQRVFQRFGADKGADMPVSVDWTRGLHALLNAFGQDERFRLILFTLDESTYGRELAPLAGHYPAVRLGAPWWFFDSLLGFQRYLDAVVETAGVYNLAGFVDDTRAFPSIPARHDVWRRAVSSWLAEKVEWGVIDEESAPRMARWLAYEAPKDAYRLG